MSLPVFAFVCMCVYVCVLCLCVRMYWRTKPANLRRRSNALTAHTLVASGEVIIPPNVHRHTDTDTGSGHLRTPYTFSAERIDLMKRKIFSRRRIL